MANTLGYPPPRGRRRALLTRGRPSRNETRRARKSAWCELLEWRRAMQEKEGRAALSMLAQVDLSQRPIPQDSALHFGGVVRSNGGDRVPRISRLGGKRNSGFGDGMKESRLIP